MKFRIKWPNGTLEDSVSECETKAGFINERWGNEISYEEFLQNGGELLTEEEEQAAFGVFQEKLAAAEAEEAQKAAEEALKKAAATGGDSVQ